VELDVLMDEHHGWAGLFEAFEKARKPNTDAIARMALENYLEMRSAVLDPEYRERKKREEELAKKDPEFISRYAKVMFHPEIPYSDIVDTSLTN
jgi:kynurenine 3-monooxygenase